MTGVVVAQRAIVTGGAGDIGRASATALAQSGFDVVLFDLLEDADGQDVAAAIALSASDTGRAAARVRYAQVDCSDEAAVSAAFDGIGRVDFVLLNAAVVTSQPFLQVDAHHWRRQLDVNLTGAFFVAQAAARAMVAEGAPGHLLFMSSWVAEHPWPELAAYTASKSAINQLARQIASELAPHGVRANALAPGIVRAGLSQGLLDSDPAYAARVASSIPLGELQTAAEIGQMVALLASPAARSMTGSVVTMDGGCSLGAP